jgi:GTP pyrophosphokinase
MIEVEWSGTNSTVFRVHIEVQALDRSGLLSDITKVLSEHHLNILSAAVTTDNKKLATQRFVF